ncbi:ATP dependent RNA helicase [Thiocystis violacea]|uniref:ATP dependent RNA helicase n=1 Tax=Thiocystis violacea TaxID=13725 RepID=UPI00190592FE|nr:ATP dependent RNA helicase [Thiocystis violacea]MBK1720894.1 hypothetical protein [Thiocystis violacea]
MQELINQLTIDDLIRLELDTLKARLRELINRGEDREPRAAARTARAESIRLHSLALGLHPDHRPEQACAYRHFALHLRYRRDATPS